MSWQIKGWLLLALALMATALVAATASAGSTPSLDRAARADHANPGVERLPRWS